MIKMKYDIHLTDVQKRLLRIALGNYIYLNEQTLLEDDLTEGYQGELQKENLIMQTMIENFDIENS